MKIKIPPIQVPLENIYEQDKLARKASVEVLSTLLRNVEAPLVLSVNAPWGAGKTSFLKMLHANLRSLDTNAVYFSAWETDFASDPLLAFLGEMNGFLSEHLKEPRRKRAWNNAKAAGEHILKRLVPAAIKVVTAGVLDLEEALEDEAASLAESFSRELIEGYGKSKQQIEIFKENIGKMLSGEDGAPERLCIFVDELDRCRPTYAIELLERIKHLLDVPGLVFVVALDKAQLSHSVKAVYGSGFDASGYLRRFIDVEYSLPVPDIDVFVDYLFETNGFARHFNSSRNSDSKYDGQSLLCGMQLLAKSQRMSLRTIEQLVTRLKLLILSTPADHALFPELTLYLIYLRDFDRSAYDGFVVGGSEALKSIQLIPTVFSSGYESAEITQQHIHAGILAAQVANDPEWVSSQISELRAKGAAREGNYEHYASRVIQLKDMYSSMGSRVRLKPLLRKVEMLEEFSV